MKKRIIITLTVVAVIAGLTFTAHSINLTEIVRKMHGG